MRGIVVLVFVAIALTWTGLTSDPARACDRSYRGGAVYSPYRPMYYAPPMAYSSYGPMYYSGPVAYSPYDPRYIYPPVVYTRSMYYRPSEGYRPAERLGAPSTATSVGIYDDRFDPPTLTVAPGTTVRWTNLGSHKHTVTSSSGDWDSGDMKPG